MSETAPEEISHKSAPRPTSIILVPYPKIVFLYPSVLVALGIAIWMTINHGIAPDPPIPADSIGHTVLLSKIFLAIFMMNIVVISFDFPRATSLTFFFLGLTIVLGAVILFSNRPDFLPAVERFLASFQPMMNAQFYWSYVGLFAIMFLLIKIAVQFDYWEVRPNELLHHHGFLSDLERFPSPSMKVDKEINDLFEFLMLRSGRLIIHPAGVSQAIVLDGIPFINRKEEQIIYILGARKVQIRQD